jgi:hypothetical protein
MAHAQRKSISVERKMKIMAKMKESEIMANGSSGGNGEISGNECRPRKRRRKAANQRNGIAWLMKRKSMAA